MNNHLDKNSVLPKSWMKRPKPISQESWDKAQANMRHFFDNAPILSKIPADADERVLAVCASVHEAIVVKLSNPVLHTKVKAVVNVPGVYTAKAKAAIATKISPKVKELWAKYK